MNPRQWNIRERGSISVELVLVAPVLVAVILLLVAGGRLSIASTSLETVAAAAARDASLAPSTADVENLASESAARSLEQMDIPCQSTEVGVDVAAFAGSDVEFDSVTVTVTCIVDLADVALPGLVGSRALVATASSPIDPYREK